MSDIVSVSIVYVTPQVAAKWLEKNRSNRPLSEKVVDHHVGLLRRGEFRENGEAIIMDDAGNLMNGQHRLTAAVRSGIGFHSVVSVTKAKDAFLTMDRLRPRRLSDDLSVGGTVCARHVVSVARVALAYREVGNPCATIQFSDTQIRDFLEAHPQIERAGGRMCAVPIVPSILGWIRFETGLIDEAESERFLGDLLSGAGLGATDPVLVVRNAVTNRAKYTFHARGGRTLLAAYLVKAWNMRREGRTTSRISWDPSKEGFPEFVR